MAFACKYCGYVNEVEPQYSEKQNKKYLNLEKKVKKLEPRVKEINKELERKKEKRNKFSTLCTGIGVGICILGGVLLRTSSVSVLVGVSLFVVGAGLLVAGSLGHSFPLGFKRTLKKKYPEIAESKEFCIHKYSKKIELSSKCYVELIKQKWNRSFTCCFCGEQNRFWKKS